MLEQQGLQTDVNFLTDQKYHNSPTHGLSSLCPGVGYYSLSRN